VYGAGPFFRLANEKGNKAESGPSDNCYVRCAKVPVSRQKREKASQVSLQQDCDALAWPYGANNASNASLY